MWALYVLIILWTVPVVMYILLVVIGLLGQKFSKEE
jgi:hypothetical protein